MAPLFTLSGLKGSISNFFGVQDLSIFGKTVSPGNGYIYHVFLGPTGPDDEDSSKNYTLDLTQVPASSFPMPVAFLYVAGGGSGGMPGITPRSSPPDGPNAYTSFNDGDLGGGGGGGAGGILFSTQEYINSPGLYPLTVGGSDQNTIGINSVGTGLTSYAGGRGAVAVPYVVSEYAFPPTHPDGPSGPWYPPTGNIDPTILNPAATGGIRGPYPYFPGASGGSATSVNSDFIAAYLARDHYGPQGIPPYPAKGVGDPGWGLGQPGGSGGGSGSNVGRSPNSSVFAYTSDGGVASKVTGSDTAISHPGVTTHYGNPGGRGRYEFPAPSTERVGAGGGGAGGVGFDADHDDLEYAVFGPLAGLNGHGGPGHAFPEFAAPLIAPAIPETYRSAWIDDVGPTGLYGGGGHGAGFDVASPNSPNFGAPGGGGGGTSGNNYSIPRSVLHGHRWTGGGGAAQIYTNPDRTNTPGDGGPGIIIIRRPA